MNHHTPLMLKSANQQTIQTKRVMLLHLLVDNLCVIVWFKVVENLAVDVLLEASFSDKYIRAIFPTEWKFVP